MYVQALLPDNGIFLFFSVCLPENVWEQRIRPGSLCRASVVRFICLCSLPCVGDSISLFSHHVNRFMLSKTTLPSRQPDAHCRSPLNFIRPAVFPVLQSDTGACLCSFAVLDGLFGAIADARHAVGAVLPQTGFPFSRWILFRGHNSTHLPQPMQASVARKASAFTKKR